MKKHMNKKGVAEWMSWVLIMGFAVALGVFFFAWIRGFATDSTEEISDRSERITLCESASVRIEKLCQDTQTLNINISNSNNIRIDELTFRFFNIYEEPELRGLNLTLKPGETNSIKLVKQGIVKQVEILPVIHDNGKRIVCENKRITESRVPIC